MKLEVGMYVRTKYGIAKIINIFDKENLMNICGRIQTEKYGLNEKDITKASHNIIDLIEVGDYVNGSEVVDFENEYIKENDKFIPFGVITENCYLENTGSWIIEKDIKSIVTKEQFESMQYEVK